MSRLKQPKKYLGDSDALGKLTNKNPGYFPVRIDVKFSNGESAFWERDKNKPTNEVGIGTSEISFSDIDLDGLRTGIIFAMFVEGIEGTVPMGITDCTPMMAHAYLEHFKPEVIADWLAKKISETDEFDLESAIILDDFNRHMAKKKNMN